MRTLPRFSRRDLMRGGLATLLAGAAQARAATSSRRFVFVWSAGGWDPLMAFAPMVGKPNVDMDAQSALSTVGGITFVDHPERAAVASFFNRFHGQTAILNGVSVPSLSHEICNRLAWTGGTDGQRADWPTLIGNAAGSAFSLPSLVLAGPSYPAGFGISSARVGTNGQLQALLDRSILNLGDDLPRARLATAIDEEIDTLIRARAAALEATAISESERVLRANLRASLERAAILRQGSGELDLSAVHNFDSQAAVAAEVLASGLCRCVSLTTDGYFGAWDTHSNNDRQQSPAFDLLFDSLAGLLDLLAATPAPEGGALADNTVVVVLSEMGRTPRWNSADGRDHWPYTSMMVLGAPIRGDQVISGFDDDYYGLGYDAATGETRDDAPALSAENVGATLLALADVDPAEWLPGVDPIAALG